MLTSSTSTPPSHRDPEIGAGVAGAAERRVRRERGGLGACDHVRRQLRRQQVLGVGAVVLRLVVVELGRRADLDRAEHAAVEDADEHLRAGDVVFDDHRAVVAAGERDGRDDLRAVFDDRDADRAALAARLDHARQRPVHERGRAMLNRY